MMLHMGNLLLQCFLKATLNDFIMYDGIPIKETTKKYHIHMQIFTTTGSTRSASVGLNPNDLVHTKTRNHR
jgi:hypothetical protein